MHRLKCWLILISELVANLPWVGDCWWEDSLMVSSFFQHDYDRPVDWLHVVSQDARHQAFEQWQERRRYDAGGEDARDVVRRLAARAGVPPCETFCALLNGHGRMLTLFHHVSGRHPADWDEFQSFLTKGV